MEPKDRFARADDALHRVFRAGAFVPVLQPDERRRGILAVAAEAEADHRHEALHLRLLTVKDFDLFHRRDGAFRRRADWQLDAGHQEALVFLGQKRLTATEGR